LGSAPKKGISEHQSHLIYEGLFVKKKQKNSALNDIFGVKYAYLAK